MKYEIFKATLKRNGFSLKGFTEASGIKYDTASKWGKDERPIPDWVESWFRLYEENKSLAEIKILIKEIADKF